MFYDSDEEKQDDIYRYMNKERQETIYVMLMIAFFFIIIGLDKSSS